LANSFAIARSIRSGLPLDRRIPVLPLERQAAFH